MSRHTSIWEQLQATRNDDNEEHHVRGRSVRRGLFRMLESNWSAEGWGDDGTQYVIRAAEYDPESRTAVTVFGAEALMVAVLSKFVPASNGRGPVKTIYHVELTEREVIEASGATFNRQGDQAQAQGAAISAISREETVAGFESGLSGAHFDDADPLAVIREE